MLLVMYCCETSTLLLATCISVSVELQRKEKGAKKRPGCTWIEVNNEVHTFVVEDQNQPQMIEIYAELLRLSGLMHDTRYMSSMEFFLDDV